MNKTAEIATKWADFEANHPGAEISDFCQYHIINEREKKNIIDFWGSAVPPDSKSLLAKIIGRLGKLSSVYALIALKECGLKSMDEFLYLNSINSTEQPKKTEVIYANFNELSSGLLIISRLIDNQLVIEEADNEDKRSKKLHLTEKGGKTLIDCYEKLQAVHDIFLQDMHEDDIRLCIQLLFPVESKISKKWMEDKGKSFDELVK